MINIRQGGLAIYGGIIAAALTALAVCRFKKISAPAALDAASFGFLIGQSVGRWGNFMNREAYGAETDIFCRMGLTLNGETVYVHPTFLYESLWNAVGFLVLHFFSKRHQRKFDGQFFLMYLAWYGLGRAWIEGLRTDSLYIGSSSLRVSQLVAAVTCLGSVLLIAAILKSGKCSPEKLWVNRAGAPGDTADKNEPDV
ncbi:MAG: prolipoprotein diacylglyceryl transferase [Oscillospiraceae bacterium]|nr:prolipoprotein diacylglyceryl transferase [Oscillospiraceae bacterium]